MNKDNTSVKSTLDIVAAKDHIVDWLKRYCNKYGIKGFTIGVSGGIDSALASALCAETGLNLLVVEMPIHQNEEHVGRGVAHINWLKENYPDTVKSVKLNLTDTFDEMVSIFEQGEAALEYAIPEDKVELGLTNTRSRLRMIALYQFATMHSYIVCGTGNKVEDFGVGFFSKYGDGGVDISPIADLMKSEVRAMARELGVLEEIVNAIPSDGLWDDSRSDEDQIGATYDELEWAMDYVANEQEPARESLSERQREVLEIYKARHNANRHKMDSIPVCSVEKFR